MDGPQRHNGRQNLISFSKFWIQLRRVLFQKVNWHLFYVRDITLSTRTISEYNLIKWCRWDHLLDRILMGLRVRAAGLKVFMVSIDNLVCQLCIGCSLSLSNNGTKLCVITDIFGLFDWYLGARGTDAKKNKKYLSLKVVHETLPYNTRPYCHAAMWIARNPAPTYEQFSQFAPCSYVKSHLDNDSCLPIYKTIPAICNTPHKTRACGIPCFRTSSWW